MTIMRLSSITRIRAIQTHFTSSPTTITKYSSRPFATSSQKVIALPSGKLPHHVSSSLFLCDTGELIDAIRQLTNIYHSNKMSQLNINSKLKMNSGYEIPILGYGRNLLTSTLRSTKRTSPSFSLSFLNLQHNSQPRPADSAEDLVQKAFDVGYRHIDSAAAYRNEAPCGLAIRQSPLPRSSIFFTSKIPARNLSYSNTVSQVSKTLQETGLEYIDLMLIHAPYGGSEARKGAWKALVEAQEEGKIRSIGVSNYGVHHLEELEGHIRELEEERGKGRGGVVSVGQWELHPWLPRPDIIAWCQKRNVIAEAYSPLVRGERLDSELLQPLAKKYQKTPAQILLRWSLQKGFVPLPKSVTPSRIKENADVYDFELTADEMKGLETGEYSPCCWDPTKAGLAD
ncbi:Aldo keto reductase protein [Rutstroemia sp. NJR-2017a BVV2]|nr:Aldo keto reductase protein [Rutstroemia sp. NJR-2017a BVV2]